ncbi:MAG: hypothetical protein IJE43_23470 [Alphaproteobacteria bacterium]|nr:hypothetical protein [Alphaproteobacteria bacterium]
MPKITSMYKGTVVSVPIIIDRDVDVGTFPSASAAPRKILREKIVVLYVKFTPANGYCTNKKLYYSIRLGTENTSSKARDIALSAFTTIASARMGDSVQFMLHVHKREPSESDCEIAYFKNLTLVDDDVLGF